MKQLLRLMRQPLFDRPDDGRQADRNRELRGKNHGEQGNYRA